MPSLNPGPTGHAYWRSLDEVANTPQFQKFVEQEFPNLANMLKSSPTRRQFLKLMGASVALAGLTGCRWPRENIVPFAKNPAGRIPGEPAQYATAIELNGIATGLLVTSFEGRPIKVEGNALHPFSLGATDALAQASVLEMYDPDRSQRPLGRRNNLRVNSTWMDFGSFADKHFAELRAAQGAGLCVLSESSGSPTLAAQRARFEQTFPQSRWFEYEALSDDNERAGTEMIFGAPARPQVAFDKADVIACFDADPLLTHPASLRNTREFARRRSAKDGSMNRLYAVECVYSLTGANADHRFAVRSADIPILLAQLSAELIKLGLRLPDEAHEVLSKFDAGSVQPPFLATIAKDLFAHQRRCVLMAGPRQPAAVHALVVLLNGALGGMGQTVSYTRLPDAKRPPHASAIAALVEELNAGRVNTLLILGGNPVYTAPADLNFEAALAKAPTSIHLGLYADETGRACTWHLPRAHYLEAWGDARAYDGTYSVVQPLIEPLYDGKTLAELLAMLGGDSVTRGYDLVRRTFQELFSGPDWEARWSVILHDGLVGDSAWPLGTPTISTSPLLTELQKIRGGWEPVGEGVFELVFVQDHKLHDGRFANSGWLQELPDPITKLTWDNAAIISPSAARRLGIAQSGERIVIEAGGQTLEVPAYILPGQAPGSISLALGYGRGAAAGKVAENNGFNAYKLRRLDALSIVTGVKARRSGPVYELATTQDHHSIRSDIGDKIKAQRVGVLVREATLEHFKEHPEFARHAVHTLPLLSLWKEPEFEGHAWAMSIDLSKCTGCSACVVACQSENNVPVVGKDEVLRGREMHWIRIDRYFRGEPDHDDVEMVHQPVTCMHCENAPCEQVCPVAATVHDEQGLNVMVYNRCIGTRYCSNNCPYKVRRFNWFYNHHGPAHPRSDGVMQQTKLTAIEIMGNNPNVTVRSRGVMEKCTFCTQRIMAVRIKAKNERREIDDLEVVPACAQACPAEAIIFGDLRNEKSLVRASHDHPRSYGMLEELNVQPRLRYLAKLRNPQGAGHGGKPPAHDAPAGDGHAAAPARYDSTLSTDARG